MRTETIVIELVPDVPWLALADERAARAELLTGHTRAGGRPEVLTSAAGARSPPRSPARDQVGDPLLHLLR
jgi:hypothetical protein